MRRFFQMLDKWADPSKEVRPQYMSAYDAKGLAAAVGGTPPKGSFAQTSSASGPSQQPATGTDPAALHRLMSFIEDTLDVLG